MLTRFDTATIRKQPPTTQGEMGALVALIIQTAVGEAPPSPVDGRSSQSEVGSASGSPQKSMGALASSSRPPGRASAAAATAALSDLAAAAASAASSHKHKGKHRLSTATAPSTSKSGEESSEEGEEQKGEDRSENEEPRGKRRKASTVTPAHPFQSSNPATAVEARVPIQQQPSMPASSSAPGSIPGPLGGEHAADVLGDAEGEAHGSSTPSLAHTLPPPPVSSAETAPLRLDEAAAASVSPLKEKQVNAAIVQSRADLVTRPLVVVTPEQRRAYAAHVEAQLQAFSRMLRVVPGNGDCLLASVLLGCAAIGIDVCAELGLKKAHASHLRSFLAEWIRTHKQQLFDISGGDDSWRGDLVPQRRARKGSETPRPRATRMTLDDCLDLFADTAQRVYDVPWSSTEPGAAITNLGDYIPQLLAAALGIRIVLIKAHGPPETVGTRDTSNQLQVDTAREVMVVQGVRLNHWDAALPLHRSSDRGATATDAADAATTAAAAAEPTAPSAPAFHDASVPRSPPSARAARRPVTPASDVVSEGTELLQVGEASRHRIFADRADVSPQVQQLTEQLAKAQAALKESQEQHAARLEQVHEQHAAALVEQEEAADAAAKATAHTIRRIEELVHHLQQCHQDHQCRVREQNVPDVTAGVLEEVSALQSSLPPRDQALFFDVPRSMVEQWTSDIEELETALSAPFHPTSPAVVDAAAAQRVCERLTEFLSQLQGAEPEMPFMQLLVLAKKVLCVDQLRPSVKQLPPYQILELRALLMRLTAHDRLWSFALRMPWSYLEASKDKMKQRAASLYAKAAGAAAPDVLQQARLLVEQCKVLDSGGLLHKAKQLDSVPLEYPEQALRVLNSLHTQYPAAGPPLDRSTLQQWDEEMSGWRSAVHQAGLQASEQQRAAATEAEAEAAQRARAAADELAAAPPRSYAQCMNRSRTFFHTDKRQADTTTSAEDQAAQFGQVNEAWDCLSSCRARFQELREFRVKVAALAALEETPQE